MKARVAAPVADGPTVRLVGHSILFFNIPDTQVRTKDVVDRIVRAGGIFPSPLPSPNWCIVFESAAAARKVFESAFNVDPEWEALAEAVPDDTRWEDQRGMARMVKAAMKEGHR